jgi:hypothetical protein
MFKDSTNFKVGEVRAGVKFGSEELIQVVIQEGIFSWRTWGNLRICPAEMYRFRFISRRFIARNDIYMAECVGQFVPRAQYLRDH